MAQDLLRAIGSRLEAQLNARETRLKSIEDAVKARVSVNPPTPFSLLPDGTKQFGYTPMVDSTAITSEVDADAAEAAAQTEDISDPGASFAALISATAQLFTETAADNQASPAASATDESMVITPSNQNPVTMADSPAEADEPMVAQLLTPTVSTTTAGAATTSAPTTVAAVAAAAPAVEAPVVASVAAPGTTAATSASVASATEAAPVSAKVAASVSSGFVMLADGTKQFGYAPTGGTAGVNAPAAKTPPVPADFGAGATIKRKGVAMDTPMTVTRIGDGVIFANFTDSEGTREMAFYPNQMDLLSAAP
ncbi:MAG: hypothetical protein ABI852_04920 [Gemmatimonadaceae bacterium]